MEAVLLCFCYIFGSKFEVFQELKESSGQTESDLQSDYYTRHSEKVWDYSVSPCIVPIRWVYGTLLTFEGLLNPNLNPLNFYYAHLSHPFLQKHKILIL